MTTLDLTRPEPGSRHLARPAGPHLAGAHRAARTRSRSLTYAELADRTARLRGRAAPARRRARATGWRTWA